MSSSPASLDFSAAMFQLISLEKNQLIRGVIGGRYDLKSGFANANLG
jgi:hypothetical protein